MKKSDLNRGLDHIDSDLVEEFIQTSERLEKRPHKRGMLLRTLSIAACVCLVIGTLAAIPFLEREQPPSPEQTETDAESTAPGEDVTLPPEPPVWEEAGFTAMQIASVFNRGIESAVPTSAYQKIKVTSTDQLRIPPMIDQEYLEIYENRTIYPDPDPQAFRAFVDSFYPALAKALGAPDIAYEINVDKKDGSSDIMMDVKNVYLAILEREDCYTVSIGNPYSYDPEIDPLWTLSGIPVQVDQRQSDEEILASLQELKGVLFAIFGVEFTDVAINRYYSDSQLSNLRITFFNQKDHPLNQEPSILSDSLTISFDNHKNFPGDIVSDTVLQICDVYYTKYYQPAEQRFAVSAYAKRISLEEAEQLLYNGYVFGGHACPLCQQAQDPVSFEGYDYVGMTYEFAYDLKTWRETMAIPFYVFYKQIGTDENGKLIFAKTYVAAIPVSDYETYFESQQRDHSDFVQ